MEADMTAIQEPIDAAHHVRGSSVLDKIDSKRSRRRSTRSSRLSAATPPPERSR